jgi:hypothetical protein
MPKELYTNQTDHNGYVTITKHNGNCMYYFSILIVAILPVQFTSGYVQLSQSI